MRRPDNMAPPVFGVSGGVGEEPYPWLGRVEIEPHWEFPLGSRLGELATVSLEDLSTTSVLGLHDEVPGLWELFVEFRDVVEVFFHDRSCDHHLFRLTPRARVANM